MGSLFEKEGTSIQKSTEYLDKYLFPFEKPGGSKEGYFELAISLGKCLQDDNYLSSIVFPDNMKYLYVRMQNDLKGYNLTFTDDDEINIYKKITAIIPSHIEYLRCQDLCLVRFNQLKQLKTLIIDDTFEEPFNDLPDSLVRFEIFIESYDCKLDNLPPNLKYFVFDNICGDMYAGEYSHLLNNLPHGLEVLYLPVIDYTLSIQYPDYFNNLPSGLKYLYLPLPYQNPKNNTNYNSLPDSLEIIEFQNYPDIVEKIDRYPSSLKKIFSNSVHNQHENNRKIIKKINSLNLEGKFDIYYQIQPIYENHWDMYPLTDQDLKNP